MGMPIYEIICGALVLLFSLLIVILCMMQDTKSQQNMTSAITGGSNDSFYGKNEGRTREAMLAKVTRTLGILLFAAIIVLNIVGPYIMTFFQTTAE